MPTETNFYKPNSKPISYNDSYKDNYSPYKDVNFDVNNLHNNDFIKKQSTFTEEDIRKN